MPTTIAEHVELWLKWDKNKETHDEIEMLWKKKDEKTLEKLLLNRMEFGTAGLRARMGAGNSQMNHLTIIQTAQGLAQYLKTQFSANELKTRGIVLGFDARYHSQEFAQLTANIMHNAGVHTYLFDQITPTPFVPFAIRHYKCVAGVMVTASHNPKQDNGYKVYWNNGAQIIPPHDTGIANAINENLVPKEASWNMYNGDVNPYEEIFNAYYTKLAAAYTPQSNATSGAQVRFTYTPVHGVGAKFALHSLAQMGIKESDIAMVKEQEKPDPEFTTVVFPNPEEGKATLDLSFKTAQRSNSTVILANDPDADRLAVAEKQPNGTWRVFTGNDIGALLGWWGITLAKKNKEDLSKCYFISSTVSSSILNSIAKKEGLHFIDTLTGFKWIGSVAETIEREQGGKVLFGFEEAIGFMWRNMVYDKDGISAVGIVADLARFLMQQSKPQTLTEKLTEIYQTYGYHLSYNSYVISPNTNVTFTMLKALKTMENGSYPTHIAGAKVEHVRDLSTGLDTRMADLKATLPLSATSPMLTFYCDNGAKLTLRASGTEPKVKWYTELVTMNPNGDALIKNFVKNAVNTLVRPEEFGFTRRPEDVE